MFNAFKYTYYNFVFSNMYFLNLQYYIKNLEDNSIWFISLDL